MSQFVHLRVSSEYSLLQSAARLKDVVQLAREEGMHALGFADRSGMFGAFSNVKTIRESGLQPVMGIVVQGFRERSKGKNGNYSTIALYAASPHGYANLATLASLAGAFPDNIPYGNTWSEISHHGKGLICLAGDEAGPLKEALRTKDAKLALRYLGALKEWFDEGSVFVELNSQGQSDDAQRHQFLAQIAKSAQLPVVATSEIRHLYAKDLRLMDTLKGIDQGITLEEAALARPLGASYHFRSEKEMQEIFKDFPEALEATVEIAKKAQFDLPFGERRMPHFPLPASQSEAEALRALARKGLNQRIASLNQVYEERLDQELRIISKLGFSGYFLIVWDFMRFAHERGISTGPGRGSAAGSLVAYALFITDVDPVEYGLLFERFLNPERVSWPDIDIDFEAERRYEVIEYVAAKYGQDHVAQIGTLGTLAARAAIRDVARVLKTPAPMLEKAVKKIPAGHGVTIAQALKDDPELRKLVEGSPVLVRLFELAQGVEGLPRHASVHAAGVVISRDPLAEFVPLIRGQGDIPVTQYSMEEVEEAGLLKMDFLGLRTLTICDRSLYYIQKVRGETLSLEKLPFDDQTIALFGSGDTDGCFQLESTGVKQVLKEMKPTELEDLIAVVSLYRPGPMEQIGNFLKARRGEVPITYEVPELESILRPTYGILVYQEQIMQMASVLAGFSLGEADVLRRAIGKKKKDILDETRFSFVKGCMQNGHSKEMAEKVYDLIERFADYGFNRSHGAAYAMLAHRTAYLKANYRPEFMAALMTDSVSRPDKLAQYAQDCRRQDIPVLPPDVMYSEGDCVPERMGDTVAVRLGLFAIKNVGVAAVEHILHERKAGGPFQDLTDAFSRLEGRAVSKRVMESLIMAGALDFLQLPRTFMLNELKITQPKKDRKQDALQESFLSIPEHPYVNELKKREQNRHAEAAKMQADDPLVVEQWEQELIGFIVSRDPFSQVKDWQQRLGLSSLSDEKERATRVATVKGASAAAFLGTVSAFRQVQTKKGEWMAFLSLEDGTDKQELVVFPTVFRVLKELPEKGQVVKVEAHTERGQTDRWIAKGVTLMDGQELPELSQKVTYHRLFIKVDQGDQERLHRLKRVLVQHPGPASVILLYENGDKRLLDKVHVSIDETLISVLEQIIGTGKVKTG